jgi:hypothetical protein
MKKINFQIVKFFAAIAFTVIIALITNSCKKETTTAGTQLTLLLK